MAIEFDVESLIGELNIIQKTQIPFAANQALKRFGFQLAKQILPEEFEASFNAPDGTGRPVPRTLNAVRYDAKGMELRISLNSDSGKGLSPAEYLRSALLGGEATDTSIHAAIQKVTGMYPVPAHDNLTALGAYTQRRDIRPSYAAKVITGLEANFVRKSQPASGERFIATPNVSRGGLKENRVYRIKTGATPISIFTLFDRKTTLQPIIKYEEFVTKKAEDLLPSILKKTLDEAMASR